MLALGLTLPLTMAANPLGGTVAQGSASFSTSGSKLTIQTSDQAYINWQSFNIGLGDTTTFIQPSSSSLVWNHINDPNPSQILGTLNANGYVVLQNQSGFYIGGQATINTGGLIMTTAPTPVPDFSGGGAWEFDAPPPAAKIINYGRINVGNGGSAFLIANDIENQGTISAPQGNLGLYAGKQVLVSSRPDGRGLTATVTLPQGSVDNSGKLIADAGTIVLNAQVVNQGGLIQANSIREQNGVIDIEAGDSLNLNASSVISAKGDTQGTSSGGSVTLKSANQYTDVAGSLIDVSGGTQGGNGGQIEISAPQISAINSTINGQALPGFTGGQLTLDPLNIQLVSSGGNGTAGQYNSGTVNSGDQPTAGTLVLNVSSFSSTLSQITLQAINNIEISTLWPLADSPVPATLTLQAGNNLTVDSGAGIAAGKNWTLNLTAGSDFVSPGSTVPGVGSMTLSAINPFTTAGPAINLSAGLNIEVAAAWALTTTGSPATLTMSAGNDITFDDGAGVSAGKGWNLSLSAGPKNLATAPAAGMDGIYLNGGSMGGSSLQTQDGNITIWAANEVQIQDARTPDSPNPLNNGIRTLAGGNIKVTTQFGDVNTGGNSAGYLFRTAAPYFRVSQTLGGISTAAGGNVEIDAGGNVISYLPLNGTGDPGQDAGTGAFGSQPGNVTINAGGNVYGHFVLDNGIGIITAQHDVGGATLGQNVALSLTTGAWTVNAPNGNIYLQEVRNPNGIFNSAGAATSPGTHLFTYDPQASVTLDAGLGVFFLTAPANLPRTTADAPAIFPPELYINAGPGGVFLDNDVTLFPSPYQNLQITTTGGGNLAASTSTGLASLVEMLMSDSSGTRYGTAPGENLFNDLDHSTTLPVANNPNPVTLNISGNIEDLSLITTRETVINVGGNVMNSSFSGQNLKPTDKTVINVTGAIVNSASFSSVQLSQAPTLALPQDLPPGVLDQFDTLLNLAVDPVAVASVVVPTGTPPAQVAGYWTPLLLLGHANNLNVSTGFSFDTTSLILGFPGQMSQQLLNVFSQPTITVVRFTPEGIPMVDASGHFVTDTYTWVDSKPLDKLITESAATTTTTLAGYRIGGPGEFDINAGSIDLGNSFGILSCGALDSSEAGLDRFANLATITPVGADINVTAAGDIVMVTSTIASLAGGNESIRSTEGEIDLGVGAGLSANGALPLGAFVTGSGPNGPGGISVSAYGNVNVDSSRIAAYDGGNVTVHSDTGSVDAGSGGASAATVQTHFVDPVTMQPGLYQAGVYGSGILAVTLVDPTQAPNSPTKPGDIVVTTPEGDINASLGGILQEALNGSIAGGPSVTLSAGTFPGPGVTPYVGNINLGDSGVIGGTVNLSANGNINGLIISQQNSSINAAQNVAVTVLSGGTANVSSTSGSVSGTIVGVNGATVSGGLGVSATVMSQNATVNGGPSTSTLGTTATATAAATSAAGNASTEAQAQVNASSSTGSSTNAPASFLTRLTKRVTVLFQ